ncbi:MAG: antibiotic biosynthesis monooxygenase [Rhodospirillales bacterium]|nr:antibiotic biosynthesis monooxygenase [Rhodospirillales bacterium]
MFARLFQFTIDPAQWDAVEQLAEGSNGAMRTATGFQSATFYGDRESGECGSLSIWDTRENLEAFIAASTPRMQEAAAGLLKGPPHTAIAEVYEPKS